MGFCTAASLVLCPCCWALSSAVILKGTFSSFHPFRCHCSSQVIFVIQLGLHMGFLLSLCYLSHFSPVPWPLPWHPLFLWLNFSIALLHVKASQVKLHCPKASVLWVPAPISQWHLYHTLINLSRFPSSCCCLRQEPHVFLWSDIAQVSWPRNPVFVNQLPALPFPSHAPSGHWSIFSCGSSWGSWKGNFCLAGNCLSWNYGRRFLKGQLSVTQGEETMCDCLGKFQRRTGTAWSWRKETLSKQNGWAAFSAFCNPFRCLRGPCANSTSCV